MSCALFRVAFQLLVVPDTGRTMFKRKQFAHPNMTEAQDTLVDETQEADGSAQHGRSEIVI